MSERQKQAFGRELELELRRPGRPRAVWPSSVVRDTLAWGSTLIGIGFAVAIVSQIGEMSTADRDFIGWAIPAFLLMLLPLLWFARRSFSVDKAVLNSVRLWKCTVGPAAAATILAATVSPPSPDIFLALAFALIAAPPLMRLAAGGAWRALSLDARLKRRVAVYGATDESADVFASLSALDDIEFVGLFDDRQHAARRKDAGIALNGRLDDLAAFAANGEVDDIIIAIPARAQERFVQLRNRFSAFPVRVHLPVAIAFEDWVARASSFEVSRFGDIRLAKVAREPLAGWEIVLKWLEDRVGGLILLALTAPLMLAIAVAIKIDSRGPVFFRQRRKGACGRQFTVWKFRTMSTMDDGPVIAQASKNDTRITRVGRVLRKTSLDELPQLINVNLGEMSLVGPRPHAVAHDEQYAGLIEDYVGRRQLKPGITGWAQINGFRGETKAPALMAKRIECDLWYIRNWSLWLDIKIILMTPIYGLVHKNAY